MRSSAGSAAALQLELDAMRRRVEELETTASARQEREDSSREGEARFRALVETASDWIWETDREGTHTYASPKVRDLLGYEPSEVIGRKPYDFMPPEEAQRLAPVVATRWSAARPFAGLENWNRRKDGSLVLLETSGVPFFDAAGNLQGYRGIDRDITDRKRAEEELRQRDEKFRAFVETTDEWIWSIDLEGRHTFCNPALRTILGYAPEDFTDHDALQYLHQEDRLMVRQMLAERIARKEGWSSLVLRWRHKDGSYRHLESAAVPILDARGDVVGFRGADRDITARGQAEEALRRSEAALQAAQRVAHVGSWTWHIPTNCLEWSDEMYRIFGIDEPGFSGDLADVIARSIHPDDRAAVERANRSVVEHRKPIPLTYRVVRPDGTVRIVWAEAGVLVLDAQGRPATLSGIVQDVTERKRTEDNLRQSVSLLRATLESTADGILVVDREGAIVGFNERFAEMWRFPKDFFPASGAHGAPIPGSDQRAIGFVLDQLKDKEGFVAKVRELYSQPEAASFDTLEFEDGRIFERYSLPQTIDGRPVGRVWSFRDVTARTRAEEERRQLEAQVRQAQKLESLGVLAGGIAHDFNNLLTAILGHANLALLRLAPESPGCDNLRQIEKASRQAAELCRQMLAYAGRGRLVVESVDLSLLVQELLPLLHVSISKKALLRCQLAEDLPAIEADPVQLRQIVMNLVINASEAIGDNEGVIGITTGALDCGADDPRTSHRAEPPPPGGYVFLEVADTGCGMDAETQARIFDPFFTTKFAGRGLGLAAVLGIVRKHRGEVKVASERGKGTTFRILVPAWAPCAARTEAEAAPPAWRGTGTILLVDDEELVRNVAGKMLEHCGFRVLIASDGREAIDLFRQHEAEIVCVLLDLTMPRMDGEQTFRELRRLQPDVRVILASGYSDSETMQRSANEALAGALEKPYQLQSLSAKLHEVLAPGPRPPDGLTSALSR
jgi:PAS domain S-box-containing protein